MVPWELTCGDITSDNVDILDRTIRSACHLMTLEALHIKAIKPCPNSTKDEQK